MPRDSKNRWITGRPTSTLRNTTSAASFISLQLPLREQCSRPGSANKVSLIRDFVVIDDRNWGSFTGISKSKKYLVLRCGGTNTHPLSLEAEVLRSVVCPVPWTAGLLSPPQSPGFIQRNRETKTRNLCPQFLWSEDLCLNSFEARNKITTLWLADHNLLETAPLCELSHALLNSRRDMVTVWAPQGTSQT